jgi:hypothetical protein
MDTYDHDKLLRLRRESLANYGVAYEYEMTPGDRWPLDPKAVVITVGDSERPGGQYRDIHLRKTSAVSGTPFPWASRLVPFVFIFPEEIRQATKVEVKIDFLLQAKERPGTIVLAPWPGQERQDCFQVDDLDEALAALGYNEPQQTTSEDTEVRGPGNALSGQSTGGTNGGGVQSQDTPPMGPGVSQD